MKQIPLAISPPPEPTFDNFVAGANGAALSHLRSLAMPSAPVYLWGPAGSGKTHLLRATVAAQLAGGQRVGWFDAGARLPWTLQPEWSLVVIDCCEALDADAQKAAFVLFVDATTHGVQVAAAGRVPPVDLPLRDDLRTRLGWGHVFALHGLDEAETRAALRRQADWRGIFLSDDVMDHLLTRFPRDLGHLMRVLDKLDQFGMAKLRRITVPLLREMQLEEAGQGAMIASAEPVAVVEAVCVGAQTGEHKAPAI